MDRLNIRFASKNEGQKLILGNNQYYDRLTQMDIDWRARKEDATLDELKSFAQEQVMEFTQIEIDLVMNSVSFIEHRLDLIECQLPLPEEIVFVKTTKMGRNTNYVTAPEECLAVNFSDAILFGLQKKYKSPQLIEAILDALKNFKA